MREAWQHRIARARELAARDQPVRPLLLAYAQLLEVQRDCWEVLNASTDRLSGSLDRDLPVVRACVPRVLSVVTSAGPPQLGDEARHILDAGEGAADSMLLAWWRAPSDRQFFAKAILQPYAQCLAALAVRPLGRDLRPGAHVCPFCGGAPQLSILRRGAEADGGGRHLLCATCFTSWSFRRLLCARCGEEDERRLCYFQSPDFDHLRVDACDTCRHYLKTVDLTRLGLAVPDVDEVAGAPLDVWARERGYTKIELNLIGM